MFLPYRSSALPTRSNNDKEMNAGNNQQQDQSAANDSRIKLKNEKPKEIVFVIENNVAKTVEVKRGIADDSYVEIISGLDQNKEVVSGSYKAISRELEDGSKVKVDNVKHKTNDDASK